MGQSFIVKSTGKYLRKEQVDFSGTIYCLCTVYIKSLFQSMVFKIKVKLKENQSAKFQNILLLLLVTYSDFSFRLMLDEIFLCTYMNYVI